MSEVVPNALEVEVLNTILASTMTIRIYGNNVTPSGVSSAATFTEISGGGYANKSLTFGNWSVNSGDPSYAIYNAVQQWTFTGAIDSPGTIYGYYVTRNSDGKLMWAERFPAANVPFAPINGSIIKVLPRFDCQSLF